MHMCFMPILNGRTNALCIGNKIRARKLRHFRKNTKEGIHLTITCPKSIQLFSPTMDEDPVQEVKEEYPIAQA